MNLFVLSWKYLKAKPLSALLSILLVALGIGLSSLLLLINTQITERLYRNVEDINLVVGAKGSPLQMILAYVYHIDLPTGNISTKDSRLIQKNPYVDEAIPLALGDSYKGFRIVGTDSTYIRHYKGKMQQGRENLFDMEAVIGAQVARRSDLRVGSFFQGSHGLVGSGEHVHENMPYKVVGILEESRTVLDQLIICSVSSVWRVHDEHEHKEDDFIYIPSNSDKGQHEGHDHEGHDHEGHDHEGHDHAHGPVEFIDSLPALSPEGREYTAFLVKYKRDQTGQRSAMAMTMMPKIIDDNSEALGYAIPAFQLQKLMDNMGAGSFLLSLLTWLILGISAFSIFISLYQSLKERKQEVAQMRVLGASKGQIFLLIIIEALLLSFAGALLGFFIAHTGMSFLASFVLQNYQYELSGWVFLVEELYLLFAVLLTGFLAAFLPAWQAYRSDISNNLRS